MTESAPAPRILLIDDDPHVLRTYVRILRSCGYVVDAASTAREGLDYLDRVEYDAVFSDIVMPGLSGIDLLRVVRSREIDVPVVLVTGNPRLETAVSAIEYGVARYLVKPVSFDELEHSAASAVKMHAAARARKPPAAAGEHEGLQERLDRALSALYMVFQPIFSWKEGRVYGYEALMRTAEPSFPSPPDLLAAAEQLGKLREVGRRVREAVAVAAGKAPPRATLLVNLHPMDLLDESLYAPDAPLARLEQTVVLELTERASLDGIDDLASRRARLRELGYRVAIDDLGAGYAGLSGLLSLEPELVKLDMSLVRGIDADPARRSVVSALTHLASELGMEVVAEGIETVAERDTLVGLGCDLLQGYLLGRPSPHFAESSPHREG